LLSAGIPVERSGKRFDEEVITPELCTDFAVNPEELVNSVPHPPCWFAS
jgi:hypothetical protein